MLKGSEKEKVLTKIRAEIRILTGALIGWNYEVGEKKEKALGDGSLGKKQ